MKNRSIDFNNGHDDVESFVEHNVEKLSIFNEQKSLCLSMAFSTIRKCELINWVSVKILGEIKFSLHTSIEDKITHCLPVIEWINYSSIARLEQSLSIKFDQTGKALYNRFSTLCRIENNKNCMNEKGKFIKYKTTMASRKKRHFTTPRQKSPSNVIRYLLIYQGLSLMESLSLFFLFQFSFFPCLYFSFTEYCVCV